MMHKGFVIMLMFIAASGYCNSSYAQSPQQEKDKPENFVLYFRFDKVTLEREYRGNAQSLADLDALLRDSVVLSSLDSIQVMATASPEGNFEHNRRLAQQRSKAVKGYIVWKYPKIDQHLIHTHSIDENWSGLQRLVEADSNVPYRDKVLQNLLFELG